jgi:hypothetical protein
MSEGPSSLIALLAMRQRVKDFTSLLSVKDPLLSITLQAK